MPEIDARGLVVEWPARNRSSPPTRALDGIDLTLSEGELVAVMGGIGAGKSTLALAIAGLVPTHQGVLAGTAAGAVRMVLQRPEATFLQERVLDEVSLAARWSGEPRAAAERRASAVIDELGLPADIADRDPLTLSGGEQRRVAIAAVLAAGARLTILDEPAAGLDWAARGALHEALQRLHAAGRTLVVITHDPEEAARLATRLVVVQAGRIAWDGPPGPVLGDPVRARQLGIDVAPAVQVLHDVARDRGAAVHGQPIAEADVVDALVELVGRTAGAPAAQHPARSVAAPSAAVGGTGRPPLPPLVDARARLIATALVVVAALMAQTLLAAGLIACAAAFAVAAARIDRSRVRLVVRPLIALALTLVALQLLFGGRAPVELYAGRVSDAMPLAALLRAMQAAGVMLATLALSAATSSTDLAAAVRRLLGPLRVLKVPVDQSAFVVATGLGLVPSFADELDRLRLAQRARGIGDRGEGRLARLRADALLLSPLFVAAFRRAHLLADALAVRGYDPRVRHQPWRPRVTPPGDIVALVAGAALIVVARLL